MSEKIFGQTGQMCPGPHTWFCLLLSCHHVILPVFSVWQRLSKHCTSEVCSQHALCAYMWIILATEQCSSTWPVSWNIPLCDPSEASHPTVTLLLLPVWIPRNVPVVPQTKTTAAANFGFPNLKKKKTEVLPAVQTSHLLWDYVIVLFISSGRNVLFFFFFFTATCFPEPGLFFRSLCNWGCNTPAAPGYFWSLLCCDQLAAVYYGCLSVMLMHTRLLWRRPGESLMWMTFSHFMFLKEKCFIPKTEIRFEIMWPIIYPYKF